MPLHASHNKSNNDHSKKQQRRRRSGHRRRAKATHNKTTRLHNGHAAAAAAQSQSAVFLSSLSMMQEDDARTSAPTTVTHTRDSVDTDEADGSGNAHTADTTASQSSLSSSSGSSGSNCDDAAQHEALSFWVGALCQHSRSVASPMTPSSSSSSSSVTAAVDEDTTRSSSTTATAADDAAAATRSATMTLRRKRRRRADSDKDSETGRRLLSHAPPLRSALPLYTELLSGLLGPVAVDVQVLGGVSLLRSPAAFARVLQTHERATRADLARLLRSVTVYVLVRGVHVYVLDAVSCSATAAATTTHGSGNKDKEHDVAEAAAAHAVLPLLAELLRAPAVVTIVLHIRLLCQLLFLFLGSDRVSIGARVVDVAVCSECVAQQDRQYATSSSGRDDSKGDDSSSVMHTLDDVLRALPDDVRLSLQARREAVVRWARAQGRKRAQTPSTSTSAAAAKAHAQRRGGDGSNSGSDSRSSDDDSGDSDDNSSSSSDDSDTAASSMCVHVGDAATLGDTFVALAALFAYYSHHLATIVVTTTSSSSSSSVVDCGGSVLWRQCVRRTSAHVSCARMTYHGVFVSKARYAAVCGDVHAQLVDLSRLAQMHMAGMSSSASALLLAHVHDTRQQQQRQQQQRQQQPLLLQSMRARDIVDCLLYCLDDTTRSALVGGHDSGDVAVAATVNDGDAHTNTSATSVQQQQQQPLPRRPQDTHSAGYLAYCVHFIEQEQQQQQLLHDNVQSGSSSGCSSSDVHAALRVARVWLAAHEREAYVRSLRDLLTSDCRLVVRVLPAPASNRTDAHTLAAATTTATAAASAPPVVCYSVHPRWQLHSHTTGRIFASCPNVQTLPRQPPVATYPPPPPHIASNTYTATTTVVVMPSHASGSSSGSRDAGSATHVKAGGNTAHVMLREHAAWTLRHLFVAAPGCALVSLDYNQMELRILAHLSRDATLCAQLRRRDGDALRAMACTVLSCASEAEVTAWQRQAVKTLVYGLLYGMGEASMDKCIVELMATSTTSTATTTTTAASDASSSSNGSSSKSSQDDAATTTAAAAATTTTLPALAAAAAAPAPPQPLSARALIRAFHRRYPGVQAYVRATRRVAVRDGVVRMLDGSVRRVTATTGACAAATTAAAAAARHDSRRRWQQGVSWAVQGSAADVLHSAMHTIQAHEHDLLPCFTAAAPAALIAAMHDELVYTVPAAAMALVVPRLRALMEQQSSVFDMCVPLRVSVRVGPSLGELREWHEG